MTGHTILEVKETLFGERKAFPCTSVVQTAEGAVILYRVPTAVQVDSLTLPAGTLTLGYFWTTRPYNVYHWMAPDGKTLGVYFNISDRTSINSQEVTWRDLVVDVLVYADGRCVVLDEDELPRDMDATLRETIEAVRDELVRRHGSIRAEVKARSAKLLREAGIVDPPGIIDPQW